MQAARAVRRLAVHQHETQKDHAYTKQTMALTHLGWLLHHGLEVAHQPQPGGRRRAAHDDAYTLAHVPTTGESRGEAADPHRAMANRERDGPGRVGEPNRVPKPGQAGAGQRGGARSVNDGRCATNWRGRRRRAPSDGAARGQARGGQGGRDAAKSSAVAMVVVARQRAWERAGGGASGGGTCHLHSARVPDWSDARLCLAARFPRLLCWRKC